MPGPRPDAAVCAVPVDHAVARQPRTAHGLASGVDRSPRHRPVLPGGARCTDERKDAAMAKKARKKKARKKSGANHGKRPNS